jgi:hypothetical protein
MGNHFHDSDRANGDGSNETSGSLGAAAEDEIHERAASGGGTTVRCSGSRRKLTLFGVLHSLQHNL